LNHHFHRIAIFWLSIAQQYWFNAQMLLRLALAVGLGCATALCPYSSFAQSAPTVTPPTAAPQPAANERVEQLARELEAQRQAFEAQRAALEARIQKVEEQAQAAEARAAEAQAQSELDAIMADAEEEVLVEPAVRVYGFADVGLQRSWGPIAELIPGGTTKTTFVLGNVNLYFDANPIPDWRFLTEVRLGLFPHGATSRDTQGAAPLIDNSISDDGSPNGGFTVIRWNGMLLERAHIDWTPRDEFGLRAGWFLTPYGIWNVDHGTPTRIMIEAPLFITVELMPQRQLGLEAFGRFQALPWTIGYHLYVSNGRQPGQLDYSDQKAIGSRVWFQTRRPIPMTFGVSGYTGRYEYVEKIIGLRAGGGFAVSEDESVAYSDYAAAVDASLDIGDLRLRAEGVSRWRFFEDGKRTSYLPGSFDADQYTFGAYLLAAYRLPWYGLEPLVQTEIIRIALPLGEYGIRPSAGLNIYFDPAVVLRFSYTYSRLFDLEGPERPLSFDYLHSVVARLSIAF
jgi:hypothetical protein